MAETDPKKEKRVRLESLVPHDDAHVAEEGWLISYADMMTLLFGFFVILFSMSNMDKKKYEQMSESLSQQFETKAAVATPVAPPPPPASSQLSKMVKEQLLKSGLDTHDVEIIDDGKSLTIGLRGKASFDSGKSILLPQGHELITNVGNFLKASKFKYEVRIEGHTDDAPIISQIMPTNWELSAARAAGVAHAMEDLAIAPDRLMAVGYGSSRPLMPNRNEYGVAIPDNMAKNRRVMIIVTFPDEKAQASPPLGTGAGAGASSAPGKAQRAGAAQAPSAPAMGSGTSSVAPVNVQLSGVALTPANAAATAKRAAAAVAPSGVASEPSASSKRPL